MWRSESCQHLCVVGTGLKETLPQLPIWTRSESQRTTPVERPTQTPPESMPSLPLWLMSYFYLNSRLPSANATLLLQNLGEHRKYISKIKYCRHLLDYRWHCGFLFFSFLYMSLWNFVVPPTLPQNPSHTIHIPGISPWSSHPHAGFIFSQRRL